jgi:hypothetical protein
MPHIACPLKGYEDVAVEFPDEWFMRHVDQYWAGSNKAAEGASMFTRELYGAIALCDKIEGLDVKDLAAKPLAFYPVLNWLRTTVLGSYYAAMEIPKN